MLSTSTTNWACGTNGVKLLTYKLEAVGDLLLTKGQLSPSVILAVVWTCPSSCSLERQFIWYVVLSVLNWLSRLHYIAVLVVIVHTTGFFNPPDFSVEQVIGNPSLMAKAISLQNCSFA